MQDFTCMIRKMIFFFLKTKTNKPFFVKFIFSQTSAFLLYQAKCLCFVVLGSFFEIHSTLYND